MNRIKPLAGILFCLSVLNPTAGSGSNPASEHKIDSLLRLMTLEEKVSMCAGAAPRMAFQGVPRLEIPEVQCCDGPRGPNIGGQATAFPSGIAGVRHGPALAEKARRSDWAARPGP